MYDDIAFNEENPRPGVIINSPHGNDVYKGVPKVCYLTLVSHILFPIRVLKIPNKDLVVAGLRWWRCHC